MPDIVSRLSAALSDRYAVERQVGAGGMATVYLAHDIRHDRKVALKVLRPELAAVLGAERFINEIKTAASFQHPNILPLFDSGRVVVLPDPDKDPEIGGEVFLYYVMPYIEGETLRHKLDRETQLPVEEAVRITAEVADALDYAHRRGVIHRDIKPENILLSEGRPLVADFGIALAVHAAGGDRLTQTGLSLGTPHYMSPEQATAEKELDPRSDLYSLAAMLYEMLAGSPPHTGASAQAVILKIVAEEVRPLLDLRRSVPRHVAAATAKALEKVPADRFGSAGDFSEALTKEGSLPQGIVRAYTSVAAASSPPPSPSVRLSWVVALISLAAVAGWKLRPVPEPARAPVTRFTIPTPEGHELPESPNLAVSPDGRTLAYFLADVLFKRSLGEENPEPLTTAPGSCCPRFSADGKWIYFGRGVDKPHFGVSLDGGPTVAIDQHLRDQDLVVGSVTQQGLLLRRAGDTAWVQITNVDTSGREGGHLWPQLLPGGTHVLYTALGPSLMWNGASVVVQEIGSNERVTVAEGVTSGRYVPTGHVVFVDAEGTFQGVPFDLDHLDVTGTPFIIESGIRTAYWGGAASLALSDAGTMAYVRGTGWENHHLTWVDREGRILGQVGRPVTMEGVHLSPDEQFAVAYLASRNSDISRIDLATGEIRRLTFGEETDDNPVWSPDGSRVAFHQVVSGTDHRVLALDLSGEKEVELLFSAQEYTAPRSWSSDGTALGLYQEGAFLILNLESGKVDTVTTSAPSEGGRFSPDGRWLAYSSDEHGPYEVYVVSYPALSAKQQVSSSGGRLPQWSAESGELFFVSGDTIMATRVTTGEVFAHSTPQPLFVKEDFPLNPVGYGVSADGQRFLYPAQNPDAKAREIHVVLNWFEELRDRGETEGRD